MLAYNRIALMICAAGCCVWGYLLNLKFHYFGYWSWDLPLYANLMWNLCHGSSHASLFGGIFLMDHFNAIAYLLTPFYYFFQDPMTLIYFKVIAFFAGAYVFFLLTSKKLGAAWGLVFMLGYILNFSNVVMLFFEFNFENLALPLIFLMYYFFDEKKELPFLVCCFLTAMIKENMPLVVMMFGAYGILKRRQDWVRWGLVPLALGAFIFWCEVFLLIPWLRRDILSHNGYLYQYTQYGFRVTGGFEGSFDHLLLMLKTLFSMKNLSYLVILFGPLAISLLSPQVLLPALPLFLQNLLSNFEGQQSMEYFYGSTLMAFIYVAGMESLKLVHAKYRTVIFTLIAVLIFAVDLRYIPQWQARMPDHGPKEDFEQFVLSQIPADAKVFSTYNYLCFLSQRKDLYVLGRSNSPFTHKRINYPQGLDYAIADLTTRIDDKDAVKKMLTRGEWKIQFVADEDVLLRRSGSNNKGLIELQRRPRPGDKLFPKIVWGDFLRLEAVMLPGSMKAGQRILPAAFYWTALRGDPNQDLPQISLKIYKGQELEYSKDRDPFYALPFNQGEELLERFYYLVPKLLPGEYQVQILFNPSIGKKEAAQKITRPLVILP